jgi:phosphate transport system permease protein
MLSSYLPLVLVVLVIYGYMLGRGRIRRMATAQGERPHSQTTYYGLYVALWCGLPAIVIVLAWLLFGPVLIDSIVMSSVPDSVTMGMSDAQIGLLQAEIKAVASGVTFGEPADYVVVGAEQLNNLRGVSDAAMFVVVTVLAIAAIAWARHKIATQFRARNSVERTTFWLMVLCSVIAIVTTVGIVLSLLVESFRFFELVPISEFLFGTNWEPQMPIRADQVAAEGAFGAMPVFAGTLLISVIAMAIAVPIGLLTAMYLAEYAHGKVRATVKPVVEILAGVPTIVYGFFAVLTVAPWLREVGASIGIPVAPNSAIAAGAVMGIMIIPFISSLSDDALHAVPQNLRDGAAALGATHRETILQVVFPAALPGIVGGVLLAVSRAIGETMIVVMAAGLIANATANPFEAVTTVTVQIVTLLIGDTEFDSPKTLAAFALGLLLFVVTLGLNIIALTVTKKYRERYE